MRTVVAALLAVMLFSGSCLSTSPIDNVVDAYNSISPFSTKARYSIDTEEEHIAYLLDLWQDASRMRHEIRYITDPSSDSCRSIWTIGDSDLCLTQGGNWLQLPARYKSFVDLIGLTDFALSSPPQQDVQNGLLFLRFADEAKARKATYYIDPDTHFVREVDISLGSNVTINILIDAPTQDVPDGIFELPDTQRTTTSDQDSGVFTSSLVQPGDVIEKDHQLLGLDGVMHSVFAPDRPTLLYFANPLCGHCTAFENEILKGTILPDDLQLSIVVLVSIPWDEKVKILQDHYGAFDGAKVFFASDPFVQAFGIPGTPAFVLLGEGREVLWSQVGYSRLWTPESFLAMVNTQISN